MKCDKKERVFDVEYEENEITEEKGVPQGLRIYRMEQ